MNDRELIRKVKKGDRGAFETVVVSNQSAVYGYLRARVLQASDADDLTQEVFLRFYEARHRFKDDHKIRPWLIGIARNLLREHVRRLQRDRKKEVAWTEICLEVDSTLPEDTGTYDDALVHLPNCMENLGPSAKKAIDLKYGGRLALAEIGRRLRRSEGAIKLLVYRARQALKSCLEGKLGNGHG